LSLYLLPIFGKREFELPDERDQECVHLDNAIKKRVGYFCFRLAFDRGVRPRDLRESPSNAGPITSGERDAISKGFSTSAGSGD
jgi:hypothetical protein